MKFEYGKSMEENGFNGIQFYTQTTFIPILCVRALHTYK